MLAQLALPAQGYLPTTYRAFAPLAMAPSINLPNVQIEHPHYQVTEGANLTINIRLSVAATTPVTVKYATYLVSASSNDLQVVTNTLTFNSGETTKQITIATLQDSLIEQHEQFNLGLSEVVGATYGRTGPTIVMLIDDDANTQLSPSIPRSTVTAFQTYDWALNVYPEADSVPINIGQSQPVRFNIQAERQGLGMVQYRVVGSLAVANSGNVAAEIDTASLEIHYRLGTTQTYTMGADLVIDPLALTLTAGTNRTFPFSTTFVFATANGSAPSNLSYLAIVANVRAVDQAGPPRTPWSATRTLATTLPAPTIRGATITLQSNSVVEPSTLAAIASTPANYQTSSSVSYQHSANVTRVQNGQAMVVHTVSIPETGLSILAETPLQTSSATNEATLEFLDLEPRAAITVDAIPFTATLRVYDGINLNPAGINLVETDALPSVLT
ncbi:Calx-beta domain-containing protein [Herpetosiphon gulosus]|uniref:Calx-beta domain-containing protein n=1 Tax=Herpetosiphon gulosus TaxID=1973496 RepID=A0ABP9X4R3_9CHLR